MTVNPDVAPVFLVVLACVSTPVALMVYSLNPPVPYPAAAMYLPLLSRATAATSGGPTNGEPLITPSVPLSFENPEIDPPLAAEAFPV